MDRSTFDIFYSPSYGGHNIKWSSQNDLVFMSPSVLHIFNLNSLALDKSYFNIDNVHKSAIFYSNQPFASSRASENLNNGFAFCTWSPSHASLGKTCALLVLTSSGGLYLYSSVPSISLILKNWQIRLDLKTLWTGNKKDTPLITCCDWCPQHLSASKDHSILGFGNDNGKIWIVSMRSIKVEERDTWDATFHQLTNFDEKSRWLSMSFSPKIKILVDKKNHMDYNLYQMYLGLFDVRGRVIILFLHLSYLSQKNEMTASVTSSWIYNFMDISPNSYFSWNYPINKNESDENVIRLLISRGQKFAVIKIPFFASLSNSLYCVEDFLPKVSLITGACWQWDGTTFMILSDEGLAYFYELDSENRISMKYKQNYSAGSSCSSTTERVIGTESDSEEKDQEQVTNTMGNFISGFGVAASTTGLFRASLLGPSPLTRKSSIRDRFSTVEIKYNAYLKLYISNIFLSFTEDQMDWDTDGKIWEMKNLIQYADYCGLSDSNLRILRERASSN